MPITIEVRDSNIAKSMMQLKRTLIREGLFKELKKRKLRLMASTGAEVQKVVANAMKSTSPAVVAKVRKLVFGK